MAWTVIKDRRGDYRDDSRVIHGTNADVEEFLRRSSETQREWFRRADAVIVNLPAELIRYDLNGEMVDVEQHLHALPRSHG
jgi:hypothetical protein